MIDKRILKGLSSLLESERTVLCLDIPFLMEWERYPFGNISPNGSDIYYLNTTLMSREALDEIAPFRAAPYLMIPQESISSLYDFHIAWGASGSVCEGFGSTWFPLPLMQWESFRNCPDKDSGILMYQFDQMYYFMHNEDIDSMER